MRGTWIVGVAALLLVGSLGFACGHRVGVDTSLARKLMRRLAGLGAPGLKLEARLPGVSLGLGESAHLRVSLWSDRPIDESLARDLRLELAVPGGWERSRPVMTSSLISSVLREGGRLLELSVPLHAFAAGWDEIGGGLRLMVPGEYALRLSVSLPGVGGTVSSAPVHFRVLPYRLETVRGRGIPHFAVQRL